ncbi:hypothetical protein CRE_28436 [Caenorhabditis remanei]|uniref:Uncharacterized protein n=1 Tax=Caenorhabditis remanei TaxID=31234 RepID=E3LME9_CAERE|nr:hypothetical protein CRE_28436 [Caenorhabditis remanei]
MYFIEYSFISFLLFQFWIQGVAGECRGELNTNTTCSDGFPTECKSTCGCNSLTIDGDQIKNMAPFFFSTNNGTYIKASLTWKNCNTVTNVQCPTGYNPLALVYAEEDEELNSYNNWRDYASSTSYECKSGKWEKTSHMDEQYFYSCKQK